MHNTIWCSIYIPSFMIIGSVVSEELRWQGQTDGRTDGRSDCTPRPAFAFGDAGPDIIRSHLFTEEREIAEMKEEISQAFKTPVWSQIWMPSAPRRSLKVSLKTKVSHLSGAKPGKLWLWGDPERRALKQTLHTWLELTLGWFGFEEILIGKHTVGFYYVSWTFTCTCRYIYAGNEWLVV